MHALSSNFCRSLVVLTLLAAPALAADATPLFRIDASGIRGQNGLNGRDYRGSRARDGWSGSDGQRGGDGADGRSGTPGYPGRDGGDAGAIEVWITSDAARPGVVQIRGTVSYAGGATRDIPLQDITLKDDSKIELLAFGGRGGNGGNGGSGEDGGRGGRGGRASQYSYRAGDGGAGGNGGDGAVGADAGNGGSGGTITLHLQPGDEGLTKWIDAEVSGGMPGSAGYNGHAGYGGRGGEPGDRCYSGSHGTACASPGSSGRDGYTGRDGVGYAHDGLTGQTGTVKLLSP